MHGTRLVIIVLASFLAIVAAVPVIPFVYPLYLQCDPRWGNNVMAGNITICDSGCAMSCVAAYFHGRGILAGGKELDPSVFNVWLQTHKGYVCDAAIKDFCADLNLNQVPQIAPGRISFLGEPQKPSLSDLVEMVKEGTGIALHVRNKHHFVLMTGWESSMNGTLYVNDPFYNTSTYEYADVADVLLYLVHN
eukprot:ANDGO_05904.mRNA.1 hypothetical protein DDB_G0280271